MHEDLAGGKMLWEKPGLVALKETGSSGQNILDWMQETEEQLMNHGLRPKTTKTPFSLSQGAWFVHLTLPWPVTHCIFPSLLPLTRIMDEIFTDWDLSNDLLVCLPVELRRQITMLTAPQTVGDRAAKNKLAPRVGVTMVL